MYEPVGKYISQKVNKVRWQPPTQTFSDQTTWFVSGSWDSEVNYINLWQDYTEKDVDDHSYREPGLLCELVHNGDVHDIKFLGHDKFATASSNGSVYVYSIDNKTEKLALVHEWSRLHSGVNYDSPCTSVTTKGDDSIVSVGEDGKIKLLELFSPKPVHAIDQADSCTINGVCFLANTQIATVNSIGQLKTWDLRAKGNLPSQFFNAQGDRLPIFCVDRHPTQPHVIATGGQDSFLTFWDTRHDRVPVSLLQSHAHIWEVLFHPSCPNSLFTCSNDGSLWHWDASTIGRDVTSGDFNSPWLASDTVRHRLQIQNLLSANMMSVNSLDIYRNTLVCGTDAEQLIVIKDLSIN